MDPSCGMREGRVCDGVRGERLEGLVRTLLRRWRDRADSEARYDCQIGK